MMIPEASLIAKDPAEALLERATDPYQLFQAVRSYAKGLAPEFTEIYEERPSPVSRPAQLEISALEGFFKAQAHYQEELEKRLPETVARLKALLRESSESEGKGLTAQSGTVLPVMLSIIQTDEGDLCLSWEPELPFSRKDPAQALSTQHPEALLRHTLIHIPPHLLPHVACAGGVKDKTVRSLCSSLYTTLHLAVVLSAAELEVEIGTWVKFDKRGAPKIWPLQDRLLDFIVPDREQKVAAAAKVHLELEHRLAQLGVPDENAFQSLIQDSVFEGVLPEKVISEYTGRPVKTSEVVAVMRQRSKFEGLVHSIWQEGSLAYRAWGLIRPRVPRDQLDPQDSHFSWDQYQLN